ncbi:protein kinase [Nonomuraea sp. NPDC049646]|uniref:protein kinase domain-containing protein n=1 Tax=unclassified Nonomuraea TaxID=2593643 RepID=UPI00379A2580
MIGGRYRLESVLGGGGFGRVWKAHDESLDVPVAVKEVWLPSATSEEEHAQRLRRAEREARNAARLRSHPHIVTVHDVVIEDRAPWIVMELVDGGTLAELIARDGPLPPAASRLTWPRRPSLAHQAEAARPPAPRSGDQGRLR